MLGRLFGRKQRKGATPVEPWSLDRPLFHWAPGDDWTIRDSVQNTLITGATGSGKTSGSGNLIAQKFLAAGYGGMIMCVKDDRAQWEALCRKTGRELIIWGADFPQHTFNFLAWEMNRPSRGGGYTENVVQLFCQVMEVANRGSGGSDGREDGSYWLNAMRQLLRATIDLLHAAGKELTVKSILQVIVSAPKSPAELKSEQWMNTSFCFQCLADGQRRARAVGMEEDFESVKDYWCDGFAGLADKTRSNVVSSLTSVADMLSRGLLRRLLCTDTTITPTMLEEGKILLLDLPLAQYGALGQIAQQIMKYAFFQKSIERRDVQESPRPVFLFVDEAQFFVSSYDMLFLSTCRSSRVANVYLTQNISSVYAALNGGPKAQAEANSMFGNFGTKVMHANSDYTTTEWQANLLGRRLTPMMNGSVGQSGKNSIAAALGIGRLGDSSAGFSEQLQWEMEPSEFSRLKTGGAPNGGVVQGVVFQNGRRFNATGRSWMVANFLQESGHAT